MKAYNDITSRGIYILGTALLTSISVILLVLALVLSVPANAQAQTCTTRVTENVIHSHRGPKIMVTEHRTCGPNRTTSYYYRDHANGYTNRYRSHGNHSHRSFERHGYRHYRPRHYRNRYHRGYEFEIRDPNFYIRFRGGN